ncbi:hypothetical protein [Pseudosulfitobacter pseudonitzschiae]|uniref:hypothetical protein n=1 Tax=Pseudosulfitobacter pseudonitzschiae TaxID=1402135 RepID=UPI003B7F0E2B
MSTRKPSHLNALGNEGFIGAIIEPDGGKRPIGPLVYSTPEAARNAAMTTIEGDLKSFDLDRKALRITLALTLLLAIFGIVSALAVSQGPLHLLQTGDASAS